MGEALDMAKRFYAAFEAGDFEGGSALFAPDCTNVTPAGSMAVDEHEQFGRAFKDGLPNARMVIEDAVEAGDAVAIRGRFRGTHTGDLVSPEGSIPASGRELDMPFADFLRVRDGRIVEHHVYWDQMGMLAQLGALAER